ncbi:metabolite traffic protein EboE [Paractinoplanes brasiliensis]|uniref:Xylose isomerase-like TIM barrel protein n=1 Tax=Paractinoplanes brasiliensis TaxID=52695 RepID=A0A4R6JPX2_9ACTN|nr:metabolite traffic protein EboE [Actinoplanes brasiliensis]TDO37431.1 xylose isomerase-like TIM barrel protein [Actinoplanes brasiliensis]GID29252.1 xylose isomerase [Actinoplanes brasiliensis]
MHLSYCTNVHAAETLDGVIGQLDTYALPIRQRLGSDVLGLGLWLAAPAAAGLAADPGARRRLRSELDARGLEVVTLNGFPYEAFQAPVVKLGVYHPDWTSRRRLGYTLQLARVLVDLMPDEASYGSVSSLPIAWRTPWDGTRASAAYGHLDELARGLARIETETGRTVKVGFEPEPGCLIENTTQAAELLAGVDTGRLGVCLDLAHLAVAWEEPAEALHRLRAAGVPVVKVQMSAALQADDPIAAAGVLRAYVEPRFLHQTRSRGGDATDDLDTALDEKTPGPWRIHYHVPLHAEPVAPLTSTIPVLRTAVRELLATSDCAHYDVETYTWGVLPAEQRPRDAGGLADGIAAELAFARDLLTAERVTR